MDIDVLIANILVKTLDIATIFCKPKKDKVTYISYRSNELPYGMKEISREFQKNVPGIKEVYLTLQYTNSLKDKFKYAFEIVKQVYHIKTSKIVFIDGNNFVISNIHKNNTKVIQLWHASGAIKKFGLDYKRKYAIKNYDYVITSSKQNKSIMASAFGMKTSQILPLGYADADVLLNDDIMSAYKEEVFNLFPEIKGKKVVLYAPTFRGDAVYEKDYIDLDLSILKEKLGEEYALIYKMHPILGKTKLTHGDNVYNANHIDIYKLFSVADVLVSDYSSIVFDFALLEKPVILFAPDLEKYCKERGFYEHYYSFSPYPVTTYQKQLVEEIHRVDEMDEDIKTQLKKEFFEYTDGKSAERIVKFALNLIRS